MIAGPDMDKSSGALETIHLYWFFLLMPVILISLWGIQRGVSTVGELSRGTLDVILSRPIGRGTYLLAHVLVTVLGLIFLGVAIIAGNRTGGLLYETVSPPTLLALGRPLLNLLLVGFAVFGYTFFLAAVDRVVWRPLMIGAGLTLAQFVALAVANQPRLRISSPGLPAS